MWFSHEMFCKQNFLPTHNWVSHLSHIEGIILSFCCLGGWAQMILQVKKSNVEFLDWLCKCVVQLWSQLNVQRNPQKAGFEVAYARTTALVDFPAVIIPNYGIVLCDKTARVRVYFNWDQPKAHLCALIMLFNCSWYAKGKVVTDTRIQVFFSGVLINWC